MSDNPSQSASASLKQYYENHMDGGQGVYFRLVDGQLVLQSTHKLWMEAHLQKALRLLDVKPDNFLVDIGCGEGYLTLPLAQRAKYSVGFDLALNGLRVIQAQTAHQPDRLGLATCEANKLPLPTAYADKLICNHVLEHVLDDDAIVQEMQRVVKLGGLILIGVPLALAPQTKFLIRLRRLLLPKARRLQLETAVPGQLVPELIGVRSHIRFYDLASLSALLSRHGFTVLQAEGIGFDWGMERGRNWIRRHKIPFALFLRLGKWFPAIGDGVLVLARRERE
jgi:ubiquinone/menaquinone biosynthesis C-methylase UbiE